MTAFIMNRSIWASGRLNVPSSSMGFSVAITMNGLGSSMRSPPIVVAPSAMASSIADCVLALDRLISSSNTKLAWIGPIWVENRWVEKSNTWVPTRSDGMRSGMHCTRRLGRGGLGQAGHGFDEDVAACDHRGDQRFAQVGLSDQRLGESGADAVGELPCASQVILRQRGGRRRHGRAHGGGRHGARRGDRVRELGRH